MLVACRSGWKSGYCSEVLNSSFHWNLTHFSHWNRGNFRHNMKFTPIQKFPHLLVLSYLGLAFVLMSEMLKSFWTSRSKSRILQIMQVQIMKYALIFQILCQSEWNYASQNRLTCYFQHHCNFETILSWACHNSGFWISSIQMYKYTVKAETLTKPKLFHNFVYCLAFSSVFQLSSNFMCL